MGYNKAEDKGIPLEKFTHDDLIGRARFDLSCIIDELIKEQERISKPKKELDDYELTEKAEENLSFLQEVVDRSPALAEYLERGNDNMESYPPIPIGQNFPWNKVNLPIDLIPVEFFVYGYGLSQDEPGLFLKGHGLNYIGPEKFANWIRENDPLAIRFARMDKIDLVSAFQKSIR